MSKLKTETQLPQTIVMVSACKSHKPKILNYLVWNDWAQLKIRKGHKQKKCLKCGKWYFKVEM